MKRISNAYQLPSILLVLVLALSTAVHAQDASGWNTLDANKIKNVGLREKYTYHNMCHVASWMECDASVLIDRMWKKQLTDHAFARGYAYPFHSIVNSKEDLFYGFNRVSYFNQTKGDWMLTIVCSWGDAKIIKYYLATIDFEGRLIDYLPILFNSYTVHFIDSHLGSDGTVSVQQIDFGPGGLETKTAGYPIINEGGKQKGRLIDAKYILREDGKFHLLDKVIYRPRLYGPTDLVKSRRIANGSEEEATRLLKAADIRNADFRNAFEYYNQHGFLPDTFNLEPPFYSRENYEQGEIPEATFSGLDYEALWPKFSPEWMGYSMFGYAPKGTMLLLVSWWDDRQKRFWLVSTDMDGRPIDILPVGWWISSNPYSRVSFIETQFHGGDSFSVQSFDFGKDTIVAEQVEDSFDVVPHPNLYGRRIDSEYRIMPSGKFLKTSQVTHKAQAYPPSLLRGQRIRLRREPIERKE